jgi:hypothetical protein
MAMGNPGLWAHFSRSPRELRIPNDLEFPNGLLVVCGLPGLLLLFFVTVILLYPFRNKSDLPLINPGKGRIGILRGYRARKTFAAELPRLVTEGLSKVPIYPPASSNPLSPRTGKCISDRSPRRSQHRACSAVCA